ncbi:MAG: DUF692 domain-containing protein [Alphaproteobacteria bacterium]|nr:DUF692 domain-containing protein [Alphaproteobacteria bacterium]
MRAPLSTGVGLRTPHSAAFAARRPKVGFLEIHAENYLGGGPARAALEDLRRDYPLSIHAVGLSLGSAEGVDADHLARVSALVERLAPALISDHLSWSAVDGTYFNDLLPLPYTIEALRIVAENVARVQDRLRRRMLIENPSRYVGFRGAAMSETAFLAELVERTGCGILLDVNNLHVSAHNLGGDAEAAIADLSSAAVGEIHLAGHARVEADGETILIDDHGSAVDAAVWRLFESAAARFGHAPALIEWDSNLPSLDVLVAEAEKADRCRATVEARRHRARAA